MIFDTIYPVMQQNAKTLESWAKTLPASEMVFPERISHRIKYVFWRLYTPHHTRLRDTLSSLKILRHSGRQDFLIGKIAPHSSIEEVATHLVTNGYGNHFIALKDDDQVVSLRYADNFIYQYHVRIFSDGEVRGHYEYTPECYPLAHWRRVGMEDRSEEMFQLLRNFIVR